MSDLLGLQTEVRPAQERLQHCSSSTDSIRWINRDVFRAGHPYSVPLVVKFTLAGVYLGAHPPKRQPVVRARANALDVGGGDPRGCRGISDGHTEGGV